MVNALGLTDRRIEVELVSRGPPGRPTTRIAAWSTAGAVGGPHPRRGDQPAGDPGRAADDEALIEGAGVAMLTSPDLPESSRATTDH